MTLNYEKQTKKKIVLCVSFNKWKKEKEMVIEM